MQVNVAENGYAVAVIKADVVIIYFTLNCSKLHGVRRVFYRRLRAHDLKEARETCRSLHVKLRKLRQLPHRRHKGRDIEREGDKVDVIHLILHDEQAADRDDDYLHDAGGKLHAAVEQPHRLVIFDLRPAEHFVCAVELIALLILVRKGFRGADAGDAALDGGTYLRRLALDLDVGFLHLDALLYREPRAERQRQRDYKRELPLHRKHHR